MFLSILHCHKVDFKNEKARGTLRPKIEQLHSASFSGPTQEASQAPYQKSGLIPKWILGNANTQKTKVKLDFESLTTVRTGFAKYASRK